MKEDVRSGDTIYELIKELYPICRSITGDGVRRSLGILREHIPIEIHEIATGTDVFDWKIPKEWNIRDAWIKDSRGEKIVDFSQSNLHVLNYSIPVDQKVTLTELKEHLYTLPEFPDWIPYRTSYYRENWGFCLSYRQFKEMKEDQYHVYIDSSLDDGHLSYGELLIPGQTKEEFLISCHICHPSLCNDNLSGVSTAVFLAKELLEQSLRYSYRFLFIPGTIGSIAWMARHEKQLKKIRHGLVLSCIGDPGSMTYKKSRSGDAEIDRAVQQVMIDSGDEHEIRDFAPYGYDERQYCSPGFNLPVGCLMRTPFGEFPEYHTSADNLDLVNSASLADSFSKLKQIIHIIETNQTFRNLNPKCEPNLGERGLYSLTGGNTESNFNQMAILWVLNLSDGTNSLLDISGRSGMSFSDIKTAADALKKVGLLEKFNK